MGTFLDEPHGRGERFGVSGTRCSASPAPGWGWRGDQRIPTSGRSGAWRGRRGAQPRARAEWGATNGIGGPPLRSTSRICRPPIGPAPGNVVPAAASRSAGIIGRRSKERVPAKFATHLLPIRQRHSGPGTSSIRSCQRVNALPGRGDCWGEASVRGPVSTSYRGPAVMGERARRAWLRASSQRWSSPRCSRPELACCCCSHRWRLSRLPSGRRRRRSSAASSADSSSGAWGS